MTARTTWRSDCDRIVGKVAGGGKHMLAKSRLLWIAVAAGLILSEIGRPQQSMLYAVENAYNVLMAGFTTAQSVGAPLDRDLRDAIARGTIPGPRLLTSLRPVNETTGTPEQIRKFVRDVAAEGADLIKIF